MNIDGVVPGAVLTFLPGKEGKGSYYSIQRLYTEFQANKQIWPGDFFVVISVNHDDVIILDQQGELLKVSKGGRLLTLGMLMPVQWR